MTDNWYDLHIIEKQTKIVCKMKNNDGSFKKSIIVPTALYPLNKTEFKIFKSTNTEEIKDKQVCSLIDKIEYKIGKCYQNSQNIYDILSKNGYDVKMYVGWLFLGESVFPVHHAWCVLNDKHIIDLADDFTAMLKQNGINSVKDTGLQSVRSNALLEFTKKTKGLKNSERCGVLGKCSNFLYYVGSECFAEEGRKIYRDLVTLYPDHECQRNVNSSTGLNNFQSILKEENLL